MLHNTEYLFTLGTSLKIHGLEITTTEHFTNCIPSVDQK